MPKAIEVAWLIPILPLAGAIFIGALLISFNRTMNRLSKPVAFVLIACASISAIISYFLLAEEFAEEVTKAFSLNGNLPFIDFQIHIDFIVDKIVSIILSIISTLLILAMITYHKIMYRKEKYVFYFTCLSLISSALLGFSISATASNLIESL